MCYSPEQTFKVKAKSTTKGRNKTDYAHSTNIEMELGITVERIKAISGQYDLSSIENLDLSKSGIMTVENLEPLTNCKVLNLSNNNVGNSFSQRERH